MSERSYFERLDENRYQPTIETQGAWDLDELHFSPLGGLLVHAIRRYAATHGTPSLQLSRVSFDILGKLSREVYTIEVRIVRPGRTIELLEATAEVGGRAVARARGWMLQPSDTSEVAAGAPPALPGPNTAGRSWGLRNLWMGRYIDTLDIRTVGEAQRGRTTAWISSPVELLAGEHDPVASYVALVDTANGVAARTPPAEWMFPNVDLTIQFHRVPAGPWVGLDTTQIFGPTGLGLTTTVLHDENGAVGVANQSLTVRRL
jgi:hypothetical protein